MCDTHYITEGHSYDILTVTMWHMSLTHLSDMFFNQFIIGIIFSSTKPERESKHTLLSLSVHCNFSLRCDIWCDWQPFNGCPHLLLVFDSSSLSYSATISSSSSWSPCASVCSPLLSWSNLNASSSSQLYWHKQRNFMGWAGMLGWIFERFLCNITYFSLHCILQLNVVSDHFQSILPLLSFQFVLLTHKKHTLIIQSQNSQRSTWRSHLKHSDIRTFNFDTISRSAFFWTKSVIQSGSAEELLVEDWAAEVERDASPSCSRAAASCRLFSS